MIEELSEQDTEKEIKEDDTLNMSRTPKAISFLSLGDSYTIGQSVNEEDRWGSQLVDRIEDNDFSIQLLNPDIIAKTGWTTDELIDTLEKPNSLKEEYNLVSLLIGVNNQYRSYYNNDPRYSLKQYESDFNVLLDKSLLFAGNNKERVMVLSIPDYSLTPSINAFDKEIIAEQIDEYNEMAKLLCLKRGVSFINITEASRIPDPSFIYVAEDLLHPSKVMYELWVDEIMEKFNFDRL